MEQPQGYEDVKYPGYVCKLKKALYGLKQAPKAWYAKIVAYLISIGFHMADADHSLYVRKNENGIVIIGIYVDDLIIGGDNEGKIMHVKSFLKKKFDMKDLGELRYFLGIEIIHTKEGIWPSQRQYALDMLSNMKGYQKRLPYHPKAKEWEQQRSTWKEKDKAKEFDEWKEQRELPARITENVEKKKPHKPKTFEAKNIQRTPAVVAETLLLDTQKDNVEVNYTTGAVGSFDTIDSFGNEQDEVQIKICQRIEQLIIELKDLRQSLPAVAKFIKKKKQAEAMRIDTTQIKDDEVSLIQLDYKNRKQWEPLTGVILDGGAGVNIIGEHMKEKMGITKIKPTPFRDEDDEDDDDDDDEDTDQTGGTYGHDQGPDDDDNQDDPPSETGPSIGGATIAPSNPPGLQTEPPPPAAEENS
ncbi:hypothetical protein L7F22_001650 [Adiantum nelumboides]|nr:hypothetical protein [Adiantum nelumboides]